MPPSRARSPGTGWTAEAAAITVGCGHPTQHAARPSRARIPCECLLSAVRPARLSRSAGARGGGAGRASGRGAFDPVRVLRGAWRALGHLGLLAHLTTHGFCLIGRVRFGVRAKPARGLFHFKETLVEAVESAEQTRTLESMQAA